jgi:ABC-type nitrate/sulfonate/bicarbonate transport system substrate-binding protein
MRKYQLPLMRPCIGLLLFCLSVSAFGADKVTLQLIWKNQFQFAGYYVAKEMGFFEEAGLDVTTKSMNSARTSPRTWFPSERISAWAGHR